MASITNARLAYSGKLLWGLVLAFAIIFGSREITAQQTQTIMLNTGLVGTTGSTLIAVNSQDDDWQVTINSNVQPAIVVSNLAGNPKFNWPAAFPYTQWVSADLNKYAGALQGTQRRSFAYQLCFNMPAYFSAPKLTIQLRADDIIRRVVLFQPEPPGPTAGRGGNTVWEDLDQNAAASATKPGSHLGPPLSISYQIPAGVLKGGQNCLAIVVEDVQQIITGLNVVGTVTYQSVVSMPRCPSPGGQVMADLSTGTTGNPPLDVVPLQADPKWFLLSSPGNPNPSTAYVTSSAWSIANTTQPANWIQRRQFGTPQADAPGTYTYTVPFALDPSLYNSIQLTLRYATDNAAIVRLNGVMFSGCPGPNCFSSWQGPVILSTGFSPTGVNSLDVVVTNNSPANGTSRTGLIVDAKLIATCR